MLIAPVTLDDERLLLGDPAFSVALVPEALAALAAV
jgi:hypothetical protein